MPELNQMEITEDEVEIRTIELKKRAVMSKNNFVLRERLLVESYLDLIPPGSVIGKDGERYRLLITDDHMENKIGLSFVADSFYALWDDYLDWLEEPETATANQPGADKSAA